MWPGANPNADVLGRAQLQRLLGNYQEAVEEIRHLVLEGHVDVSAAVELQRIYVGQGYLQKAIGCYEATADWERRMVTHIPHNEVDVLENAEQVSKDEIRLF